MYGHGADAAPALVAMVALLLVGSLPFALLGLAVPAGWTLVAAVAAVAALVRWRRESHAR